MSNVTRGWWLLCFKGCQSPGLSKIPFRKEGGPDLSLYSGLQVQNRQLDPAYLFITGDITGAQVGGSLLTSTAWARQLYQLLLHPLPCT